MEKLTFKFPIIFLSMICLQGCSCTHTEHLNNNKYEVSVVEPQHDPADYNTGLVLENRAFQVCAESTGMPYPYVKYTDSRLEAVPGGDKSTLQFQCYDPHKPETMPGSKHHAKYGHRDLPDADKTGFIPDAYIWISQ